MRLLINIILILALIGGGKYVQAEFGETWYWVYIAIAFAILWYIPRFLAADLSKLRKEAEGGDAEAQAALGCFLLTGKGCKKDPQEGLQWLLKSAEQGYAEAQQLLGLVYMDGDLVEQDAAEAMKWWRRAAEQGDAESQEDLATALNDLGTLADQAEAAKWYLAAARQGNQEAMFATALNYRDGNGVEQDVQQYTKWLLDAAKAGHGPSQQFLGNCFAQGLGMERNNENAIMWWKKAEAQDLAAAKFTLARAYIFGHGVEADADKAVELIKEAGDFAPAIMLATYIAQNCQEEGEERKDYGATLLHIFAANGDSVFVKEFMDKGEKPDVLGTFGSTPLMCAACDGTVDTVRYLLDGGADINFAVPDSGTTALHCAVKNGSVPVVKYLLEHGAKVDARLTGTGETPLHLAATAQFGQKSIELLLAAGADPHAKTKDGKTALDLAKENPELADGSPLAKVIVKLLEKA